MKKFLLSIMTIVMIFCLVGCKGKDEVKVTFETNGADPIAEVVVKEADFAKFTATAPTKLGYDFVGWYTDEALTAAFTTADLTKALEGTKEIKLYAKWEQNQDLYYYTWDSNDLGTINYWDSKESTVGDLITWCVGSYWDNAMNAEKDGYDWINFLANQKPQAQNADKDGLATIYKFEVKVGKDLVYNTLSKVEKFAAFKGREVKAEDYLTTWKELYCQYNGIERGGEGLTGAGSIKGMADYYQATADANISAEDKAKAFEKVGIKVTTEADGKAYMTVEFNVKCNPFYAMYYVNSSINSPIPQEFLDLVGGLKEYGKFNSDNTLSPVDTSLSTGYFVLEAWESGKEIVFKKNELIEDNGRYQIAGMKYAILPGQTEDPETAFREFLANKLDAASIPSTKLDEYKNDPRATTTLDASTFKLNMNTCTMEEWEALFGENGTITQTQKSDYWDVKPAMSNDSFLRGLSYSINRKELAETLGRSATGNFFGSSYLSDPENGVSYNSTEAHKKATEKLLKDTDGFGYSLTLAQQYFKKACDEMIAAGSYKTGDTITIEIAWQTAGQITTTGIPLAKYIEDAFNGCGGGLTLKVENYACAVWSDVYYKKMMVGQFDLGFGSISGNTLNPLNFLEVLKSDNSSGFTLNWGSDTSAVSDDLVYDGQKWSYDALWTAADQGAYIVDGKLGKIYDAALISSNRNADGTRTVKIAVDCLNLEEAKATLDDIVVCWYGDDNGNYPQGEKYQEVSLEFTLENGVATAVVPAAIEAKYVGNIGFDLYFTSTVYGSSAQVYKSFYTATTDATGKVVNVNNQNVNVKLPTNGKAYTYVAASYEERTTILGLLEEYAVNNFLTGLTMYGDGGYVMYQERLVPGSGSWSNYIPGYGFGVVAEGSIKAALPTA